MAAERSQRRASALRRRAIDGAFAVADRLVRYGASPYTSRLRRRVARLVGDRYSIEIDGVTLSGSLADHGTYLHNLAAGTHPSDVPSVWGTPPYQRRLFAETVEPGMLVVDCGAHIGLHTVIGAQRAGADGHVIAIEPAPPNVEALRANIRANGVEDRVELIEAAASDHSGAASLPLHIQLDQTGLSEVHGQMRGKVDVRLVALDDVMAGRRVDVLKLDVEGAETLVLDGMRATIERSSGMIAFLECHPPRLRDEGRDLVSWLETLREAGPIELIDDDREAVRPVSDEEIARLERDALAFNVRWTPRS